MSIKPQSSAIFPRKLYKFLTTSKSLQAAEAMKLTAKDLLNLGIIDEIIEEPIGGAHRNPENIAQGIKSSLLNNLNLRVQRNLLYPKKINSF